MQTRITKVPSPNLVQLLYRVENLIKAENKPFNVFLTEFKNLKKIYKANINSKK